MNRIETQLQQLNNVREAMKFWMTVPDELVYSRLDTWGHACAAAAQACGAIACFGGHLAQAGILGVTTEEVNFVPYLTLEDGTIITGHLVAYELFGTDLFNGATTAECCSTWTGHRIVQERLLNREKELLDELDLDSNDIMSLEDFPNK